MPIGGILDSALGLALAPLSIATGLVGAVATTPAAGAPAGQPAAAAPSVGGGVGQVLGEIIDIPLGIVGTALDVTGAVAGIPGLAVQAALGPLGVAGAPAGGPIDTTGFSRGNGRTANRTIVETMDLVTGQIIRRRMMPGTPHLMNSEIRAAKKVFKKSADLQKRIPRRTVKQSEVTQLKNALVRRAFQNVTVAPSGGKDC